jgi:hypothetical protein
MANARYLIRLFHVLHLLHRLLHVLHLWHSLLPSDLIVHRLFHILYLLLHRLFHILYLLLHRLENRKGDSTVRAKKGTVSHSDDYINPKGCFFIRVHGLPCLTLS